MIDLHIHTNHSDGTDTVKELLENAEKQKLEVISITDHDSVDAYYELEDKSDLRKIFSGQIIIGAELKTSYKNVSIEILAYGVDYKKLKINKVDTNELQTKNLEFFKTVLDREGFKYNPKELYIDSNNPTKMYAGIVTGKELLKYPENKELIKKFGEFKQETFFRVHQCNKNSIFYIDESKYYPQIDEVIKTIHEVGGLAFLAHGYIYPFEKLDDTIEEILKTTDIDGIECEYTLFTEEQMKKAKEFADKYNKFKSGGTDYHAQNKPDTKLGTGINNNIHVSKELISNWIDKVKKV